MTPLNSIITFSSLIEKQLARLTDSKSCTIIDSEV